MRAGTPFSSAWASSRKPDLSCHQPRQPGLVLGDEAHGEHTDSFGLAGRQHALEAHAVLFGGDERGPEPLGPGDQPCHIASRERMVVGKGVPFRHLGSALRERLEELFGPTDPGKGEHPPSCERPGR